MRIPVVSIVGKKNSGKTTLIEKIVSELKKRGYRVGTIKHDVHGFEIDYEGKDTYRHYQAGSETVVIASSKKLALIKKLRNSLPLDKMVKNFFQDVDIVITEGYKAQNKPKIECFRSDVHAKPLDINKSERIALVCDSRLEIDVPQFDFDNINGLVGFIEEQFLANYP
ncbi:MAG: molybdopterin-guanine dinucleotide biosynthesis protein B [Gemmatimonadota bacterium]|nr:MAG: molybdopterin-guanine dinucleotide biosynthesis protein B [Gemmatimonadota bacterium]